MKKILLFIIMFFMIPTIVFADDAGPSIMGYDAIIINKNGVKNLESYDGDEYKDYVVKYNTKVHVYDERYDENGEKCAYAEVKVSNGETRTFLIAVKDLMPAKSEIIPTDKDAKDKDSPISRTNDKIVIFEKDGLKLKKGPADAYGTYDDTVSYKEELRASYVIANEKFGPKWYYVNSGKYHGWIDVSWNAKTAVAYQYDEVLVMNNTKMVDDDNKVIMEIPSETILNNLYYINNLDKFYVEYKNTNGYLGVQVERNGSWKTLYEFNKLYKTNGSLVTLTNTKITSIDGKEKIKIPFGEKINVLYGAFNNPEFEEAAMPMCMTDTKCFYYVQYKNTKGFLDAKDVFSLFDGKKMAISLSDDTFIYDVDLYYDRYLISEEHLTYDEFKEKYKMNKIIPSGTSLTSYEVIEYNTIIDGETLSDTWYLVKYDDSIGFIIPDNNANNREVEEPIINPNDNPNTDKPNNEKPNSNPEKDINRTLIYGIIGGVVVAIVSLVTIIIINKKRKNNDKTEVNNKLKSEESNIDKKLKEDKKDDLSLENNASDKVKKNTVTKDKSKKVEKKNETVKKTTKRKVTITSEKEIKKED